MDKKVHYMMLKMTNFQVDKFLSRKQIVFVYFSPEIISKTICIGKSQKVIKRKREQNQYIFNSE